MTRTAFRVELSPQVRAPSAVIDGFLARREPTWYVGEPSRGLLSSSTVRVTDARGDAWPGSIHDHSGQQAERRRLGDWPDEVEAAAQERRARVVLGERQLA